MEMSRREFIKSSSLVLAFTVPGAKMAFAAEEENSGLPTHYFEISKDGEFFFTYDKVEMGQGTITGQTTMFGEEADIDPISFQARPAGVADIYATMMGQQITGGSTSTKDRWMVLRQAGAEVRSLMKMAAARKWNTSEEKLNTEDGHVVNASGDRLHYSELIKEAKGLKLSGVAPLKSRKDFRYIGRRGVLQHDATAKSTGTDQFGMDFELPNLKIAIVERCPVFGGKVQSFNADVVKKSEGVQDVFEIESGIAIVCDRYWQANKARQLLEVKWNEGKNKALSSEKIIKDYRDKFKAESGSEVESKGDVAKAMESADATVEAFYELPYLAHSAMEPMNCTADVRTDSCDVYSPTQSPTLVRNGIARLLGLSRDQVTVHTSKYLGGGFGRRSTLDYSVEAAQISQKIKAPVKVIWSREDDTKHSPMRPINAHQFRAAIQGGKVTAWEHKLGCESIMQQVMPNWVPLMLPDWLPGFVGSAASGLAGTAMRTMNVSPTTAEGAIIEYGIENFSCSHYRLGLDVPIHFWRSVGHSYTGFVVESFIDELAHKLQKDPFEFRRDLLPQNSRTRKVLEKVAEISNWGTNENGSIARGIACHASFASYVAQVADVEIVENQVKVRKVYCVVDCGIAVNPDVIVKQMESGIVYGLSAALKGQITLKGGAVEQGNFDTYEPLRQEENPEVIVHIMDSDEKPTGVGEPGLPPIAAAVGNAVFNATGIRVRELPIQLGSGNA